MQLRACIQGPIIRKSLEVVMKSHSVDRIITSQHWLLFYCEKQELDSASV